MSQVNVFLTIDTEHSIGGAFANPELKPVGNEKRIFGRVGEREYGIAMIMDIADRYSTPLTFFVEVLNKYYFGEDETREVCQYILNRGHDVQLHLHPNYLNFKEIDPTEHIFSDNMSAYDLKVQTELILEGKDLFEHYCNRSPVAFRAGSFCADYNTLKALKANGMLIDSSYNAAYPQKSSKMSSQKLNDVCKIDDVWEFPITNFIENIPGMGTRFKPLDINGVSFNEVKSVLESARNNQGPKNITIVLHSFSFIKPHDVQYQKCTVRNYVIKRFENLCRFLKEHREDFRCWHFVDFAKVGLDTLNSDRVDIFPKVDIKASLMRGFEQKFCELLS